MKCKHNNMAFYEFYNDFNTSHGFENGVYIGSTNNEGQYNNAIKVQCDDCGLSKYYNRKRLPCWLKNRLNQVINCE